jgi:signal transduction histidine kinase
VDTKALLKIAPDDAVKSRISRLETGREYLQRLVLMMEAYSRDIDLDWRPEDLVELAKESVAAARDQVLKEGKSPDPVECAVVSNASLILPISRFHFAMVLTNLIKNAIQSHAISETILRPGRVAIEISRSEDGVRITIADSGRGIAPGDLQKLLDFVPGGTAKPGGMGYGLPICRRYTEAHGGTLTMKSKEDKGTEVVITLPPAEL